MKKLDQQGIKIIVDATNDLLKKVLPYHPFLIKPNHRELEELFNVKIENKEDLIHYARKLQKQGAINVLVSLGKDGAILVWNSKKTANATELPVSFETVFNELVK